MLSSFAQPFFFSRPISVVMPLLKRKTVQFEDSLNKETQAAVERGEDIPLFQVRYTGEVFDNYRFRALLSFSLSRLNATSTARTSVGLTNTASTSTHAAFRASLI